MSAHFVGGDGRFVAGGDAEVARGVVKPADDEPLAVAPGHEDLFAVRTDDDIVQRSAARDGVIAIGILIMVEKPSEL